MEEQKSQYSNRFEYSTETYQDDFVLKTNREEIT